MPGPRDHVVRDVHVTRRYFDEISRGNIRGFTPLTNAGSNPDVGTSLEAVWPLGGAYPFPQTAERLRIRAGGNVNDDVGGLGAASVFLDYLDENFIRQSTILTTAGTSASAPTGGLVTRVNGAVVVEVGTYGGSNIGHIWIENEVTNQVVAFIPAGLGRALQAVLTIPADHVGVFGMVGINVTTGLPAVVDVVTRSNANNFSPPYGSTTQVFRFKGDGVLRGESKFRDALPGATDIWARAFVEATAANTDVTVDLQILTILNSIP